MSTVYCGDNCNHTGPHRYPPREPSGIDHICNHPSHPHPLHIGACPYREGLIDHDGVPFIVKKATRDFIEKYREALRRLA